MAERELLERAAAAIMGVYKGVGTPGDFGYESREGAALKALYDINNEIAAHLRAAKAEAPPYPFCRTPKDCAGKGYCPRDPACND